MVTLEKTKQYLRVDHDSEDDSLQDMIDAATQSALDYLNRDGFEDGFPAPVEAAILLQVGDLYENRERQNIEGAYYQNRTYERLLNPYRMVSL